jgi:hypothetical protein
MKCRDFERTWNELLDNRADERAPGASDARTARIELALREHEAACAPCAAIAARYRLLWSAITAWSAPGTRSIDLTDRILESSHSIPHAVRGERRALFPPIWHARVPLAAAAAAAAILILARPLIELRPRLDERARTQAVAAAPIDKAIRPGMSSPVPRSSIRVIESALTDATGATLALARSASEPATRIGREMLANSDSEGGGGSSDGFGIPVSPYVPDAPDPGAASALIQVVGDRIASGVRPLSATARQAFGFLLEPSVHKTRRSVTTGQTKGAS